MYRFCKHEHISTTRLAGVLELRSCSWNHLVKSRLHKTALMWARTMIEAMLGVGSVLVYCNGNNQSAAGSVLLKVLTTQNWCVDHAVSFVRQLRHWPIVRISQADYKFIDECRELARGQLNVWGVFLQFRQPSAFVVTAEEFRTQAG